MKESHRFGESEEMYLKTIAELAGKREPVPITAVAEHLDISTVSASEMIHRLQERDLLKHIPYKGVRLTPEGRRRANRVIRRHRLWECFLAHELGIAWGKVHDYACRLEHATHDEVTEALASYLGNPKTCPHGNPIPTPEGRIPKLSGVLLAELKSGDSAVVQRIRPEGEVETLCTYLAARGIKPGKRIRVESIDPYDGHLSTRVDDQIHTLGQVIAAQIVVDVEDRD